MLIMILAIIGAILIGHQGYCEWKDDPILTTVGTTSLPVEKIEFPTITLCGQVRLYFFYPACT